MNRDHDVAGQMGLPIRTPLPFPDRQIGKHRKSVSSYRLCASIDKRARRKATERPSASVSAGWVRTFGDVRRQNAVALNDEVRGVEEFDIDGVDVAGIFLPMRWNTRSAPVRSTRHRNTRIFCLRYLGQFLRDQQIGREV